MMEVELQRPKISVPEQVQKPKEAWTAAEKLRQKERAAGILKQLTKEAARIASAPDYLAALGMVPRSADVVSNDMIQKAYQERKSYFDPEKTQKTAEEIFGSVSRVFSELVDEVREAQLARKQAVRKLDDAADFLKDAGRRAKYLKEKYGIQAETSEPQVAQTTEVQASKPPEAKPQPRSEKAHYDWRVTVATNGMREFMQVWGARNEPVKPAESAAPEVKSPAKVEAPQPKKVESLTERNREAEGQNILNEMVLAGIESLKEANSTEALKRILEVVLKLYDLLKAKFPMKQNNGELPTEIVMLSLRGMLSRLNRRPDGNATWITKVRAEQQLEQQKGSAVEILNFLKPRSPLSRGLAGALA